MIVLAARSRLKTVGQKMSFSQVLKKQFQTQKELYLITMIIILSALPQTILTFSFACTQLNDWQRHTLVASYLFSYSPQILGFILDGFRVKQIMKNIVISLVLYFHFLMNKSRLSSDSLLLPFYSHDDHSR